MAPETRYTTSDGLSIAYQVVGEGPRTLVYTRFVELAGIDYLPWVGDHDALLDAIEEFLTGVRVAAVPDRVLATLLFTDVVGSTERAAELGDRARRDLVEDHHRIVRGELDRWCGREIDVAGNGFLAAFDGPARAVSGAPGEVLVSGAVKDLVAGSGLVFDDRGSATLKGVPGQWRLFAAPA